MNETNETNSTDNVNTCLQIAHLCHFCAKPIIAARAQLGYDTCLPCGEREARTRKHTIVPLHKSSYIVVTDLTLLTQLSRPGRY